MNLPACPAPESWRARINLKSNPVVEYIKSGFINSFDSRSEHFLHTQKPGRDSQEYPGDEE